MSNAPNDQVNEHQGIKRAVIYDRAAQLAPPPVGVTRDGIVRGNQLMLDEWWDSLWYRDSKTWWLNWKDGYFPKEFVSEVCFGELSET